MNKIKEAKENFEVLLVKRADVEFLESELGFCDNSMFKVGVVYALKILKLDSEKDG
jgi:hypothetical protein